MENVSQNSYEKKLRANLWKYNAYSLFRICALFVPVIVLFWQEAGLSMTKIMLLQSYFGVLLAILEIPTGTLADRFGERKSVMAGSALVLAAVVVYFYSRTFFHFIIAETLWAMSAALVSGADKALLYNTLEQLGEKETYRLRMGNARSLLIIGGAISTFFGGFLGAIDLRLTFLATAFTLLPCLITVVFMEEPRQQSKKKRTSYPEILAQTYKFVKKHRLVKWYILYTACMGAFINMFLWFYQPYMKHTGLTIAWFGIAFTFYNLVAAISSKLSDRITSVLGDGILVLMPVFLILPLCLMPWLTTIYSFMFIFFHQFNRGIFLNVMHDRILAYTFENKRSTVLSICSLITVAIKAVLGPVLGYMYDLWGFQSFYICAGFFAIVFLAFYLVHIRIPKKYFTVKPHKDI